VVLWIFEHGERCKDEGTVAKQTNKKPIPPKALKSAGKVKVKLTQAKVVVKKSNSLESKSIQKPGAKILMRSAIAPPRIMPPEEPVVEIPQAAAVPTNGRPRKNMAGISPRDLEMFRDAILAKRREIVGDMSSMEREALRSSSGTNLSNLPLHMADMGTDNYEQEFTLGLMEKDRKLLRDLNDALAKIQNGTYGICEGTGKPIGRPRLEAQPWARYSIEYARKIERHGR
jgi:DnaK suppressor protein